MPPIAGYDVDLAIVRLIEEVSADNNVLAFWVLGIVLAESGGNPLARNQTAAEDSVGLLQLNRKGGQGQGYSVEELLMPRRNLQIGVPPIAAAVRKCCQRVIPTDQEMHCVFVNSGHPGGGVAIGDTRIQRLIRTTRGAWAWYIQQLPPEPPPEEPRGHVTINISLDAGILSLDEVQALVRDLRKILPAERDWK